MPSVRRPAYELVHWRSPSRQRADRLICSLKPATDRTDPRVRPACCSRRPNKVCHQPTCGWTMPVLLLPLCIALLANIAVAQVKTEDRSPSDSTYSTGRTVLPDNKGQLQPQGWTGPNSTGSGGAPASSPQGGTPPDMQPAPGGSSKTIVAPSAPN